MVIDCTVVQDTHSFSAASSTLPGEYFQARPYAQDKQARCIRRGIYVVVADIHHKSPRWGVRLILGSSANTKSSRSVWAATHPDMMAASRGTVLVSTGQFPLACSRLSEKDKVNPTLADFDSPSRYGGRPLATLA